MWTSLANFHQKQHWWQTASLWKLCKTKRPVWGRGKKDCLPCQQNDDADDDENGEGVTGAEETVGVVQLGDAVLHQLHVGGAEPAGTPATSGQGGGLQRRWEEQGCSSSLMVSLALALTQPATLIPTWGFNCSGYWTWRGICWVNYDATMRAKCHLIMWMLSGVIRWCHPPVPTRQIRAWKKKKPSVNQILSVPFSVLLQ